jgi:PEP-CTERM motif
MKKWFAILFVFAVSMAAPALAQTAPVEVKFVGTITGSAADTLTVMGKPWTGPLPDFPYVKGDQITVSFMAQPDGYQSPSAVDGIYRYSIVGQSQLAGSQTGIALISNPDVSGPIHPSGQLSTSTGLVLVYNSNTATYSLEMPSGHYSLSQFDGPSYTYDPAANSLSLSSTAGDPRYGCSDQGSGCFGVSGSMTDSAILGVPVYGTDTSSRGFWSMLFSGDWFVNGVKQGTGGATDVPEPSQLLLFAGAVAVLMLRKSPRRLAIA